MEESKGEKNRKVRSDGESRERVKDRRNLGVREREERILEARVYVVNKTTEEEDEIADL